MQDLKEGSYLIYSQSSSKFLDFLEEDIAWNAYDSAVQRFFARNHVETVSLQLE